MSEEKKVPNLRFKGFTNDWEQRKLNSLSQINPKSTLPNKFRYVDLDSVKGTHMTDFKVENIKSAPSRAQRVAQKNDIFYQTVRPYQKNNFLFNINDVKYIYVFSTGYAQIRVFPNISSRFVFSELQTEKFVHTALDRSTGTSYPAINSNDLGKIKIRIPVSSVEQNKIGNVLHIIDKVIALQQQKLKQLKLFKKALLQKMFTNKDSKQPLIRFKGFHEDWEQHKFEDLLVTKIGIRRGPFGSALRKDSFVSKSDHAFAVYEQRNAINNEFKARYYISKEKFEALHNFHLKPRDIVMSGAGTIGKLAMVPNSFTPGVFNQALIRLRVDPNVNVNYFLDFMNTPNMQRKLTEENPGSAMVNLVPMKELKKWLVRIPNKYEQLKISRLLTIISRVVDLQQSKLSKYQTLKKFLLQNLFV